MISCASSTTSTACSKARTSKLPSGRRNFIRLSDARLQAESSTCMYSEQGFDALIRPLTGRFPGRAGDQAPVPVLLDGPHELVRDAHRVVRVLVLDRLEARAVD